jgi:tRNA threonylcarbamoyladenosine biosynthesis protein TsaE
MTDWAGKFARSLRGGSGRPLIIGLRGDLGSGKTTWARAMLGGLGYGGRVPSPTYTLLEHYALDGLDVVHLDLYRLPGDAELENLGLRDWLSAPATWLLVEWPERAPQLAAQCDVTLAFAAREGGGRTVTCEGGTAAGIAALQRACHPDPSNAR